jgi:hypothetical protein
MRHGAKSNLVIAKQNAQDDDDEWIVPSHGRHGGVRRDPLVAARIAMKRDTEKRGPLVSMYFYDQLMKEARFLAGDQVIVKLDKHGTLWIRRVTSGGFTLSPVGKDSKDRRDKSGKATTSQLRFLAPAPVKQRTYTMADIAINGDTIKFPVEIEHAN